MDATWIMTTCNSSPKTVPSLFLCFYMAYGKTYSKSFNNMEYSGHRECPVCCIAVQYYYENN